MPRMREQCQCVCALTGETAVADRRRAEKLLLVPRSHGEGHHRQLISAVDSEGGQSSRCR